MNTQTSPQTPPIKNKSVWRVLFVCIGSLLIAVGIAAPFSTSILWPDTRDIYGLGGAILFFLMTIPCITLGICLIMLNVIFKPTQPTHRYWPGSIACFFALLALLSRLTAFLPTSAQNVIPIFFNSIIVILYVPLAVGTGVATLRLTRKMNLRQGPLLGHIAIWASLLTLFIR